MKDLSNSPIILSMFNMNKNGQKNISSIIFGLSMASFFIFLAFLPMISGFTESNIQEPITSVPEIEINAVNTALEILR